LNPTGIHCFHLEKFSPTTTRQRADNAPRYICCSLRPLAVSEGPLSGRKEKGRMEEENGSKEEEKRNTSASKAKSCINLWFKAIRSFCLENITRWNVVDIG